jgi:aspartate racemase
MKKIGLIGGLSCESTAIYYRLINNLTRVKLGGTNSARIILESLNFAEVAAFQLSGDWDGAGALLASSAQTLETAGADCVLICANTMHKVVDAVRAVIQVPVIHIGEAVGDAVQAAGLKKVAFLATRYTMEEPFITSVIRERSGAEILLPNAEDRLEVHRIIYDELTQGHFPASSKATYQRIVQSLADAGAEGVIFGCTEISLLLSPSDVSIPVFDSAELHAQRAVEFSLAD